MTPAPDAMLSATDACPLWNDGPRDGAFDLDRPDGTLETAVVTAVRRPWLFGFTPEQPNGQAMLVLGGGGYTQLMVGREGVAVARWLNGLGFHAYVLVHRFPTVEDDALVALDDARQAMRIIAGRGHDATGVVGLSSGGHLAAALLTNDPAREPAPRPEVAVIGYAPISTNAAGRTIVADKPPLAPPAKQRFYDLVQPDAQLAPSPPPAFVVYAGNDPVVPVANAWRLTEALQAKGGAVELHVFADAPHGFALDTVDLPVAQWPALCAGWLRQAGFLTDAT
ncbi:alpha/beta hydrolase [Sphingomonas sp. RS2018]